MDLKSLAGWRQLAYRLFSSILLYPEEVRLKNIAAAAAELRGQESALVELSFFPQWQRLLASLADLPDCHTLAKEYVKIFRFSSKTVRCMPYESLYVSPGGEATGWVLAEIEGEYAAAGLALSPSQKDPPDFISIELEFMAFLCGQEIEAWNREAKKEGIQALKRQAAFLNEHLARWVPNWARLVETTASEGVYSVVAEAARVFISHDRDLVNTLLDKFQGTPKAAKDKAGGKATLKK